MHYDWSKIQKATEPENLSWPRLKSFKNLHDEAFSLEYRQPCVMFAGHPSLRFGEVIHFIELWGNNSNNTIVFTGTYCF